MNGIGAVVGDNIGISRGMGGAGIADDNGWNMLLSNPAVSSTFRKPAYGIGLLYSRSNVSTGTAGSYTHGGTTPTMVRFVLPLFQKIGLAWELAPFTRTDGVVQLTGNTGDTWTDTVKSTGGINMSSFEFSGSLKGVSAGIGFNYYFGSIEETWLRDFHDAEDMVNTTDYIRKEFTGYGITSGIIVRPSKKTSVGFGYTTGTSLDRSVYLRHSTSSKEIFLENGNRDIPARWRVGVSTDISRRLTAAADFSRATWAEAARTDKEKQQYQNTYTLGAGIRYIPALNSTASYLSTMPLSLGFRMGTQYYKSYPNVKSIPERAITLGLEFPFKEKSGSSSSLRMKSASGEARARMDGTRPSSPWDSPLSVPSNRHRPDRGGTE